MYQSRLWQSFCSGRFKIVLFLNLCNHLCYNNVKLFVHVQQVYLKYHCHLPPLALLWSRNCHPRAKQWPTPYISRMHQYRNLMMLKRDYVDITED